MKVISKVLFVTVASTFTAVLTDPHTPVKRNPIAGMADYCLCDFEMCGKITLPLSVKLMKKWLINYRQITKVYCI